MNQRQIKKAFDYLIENNAGSMSKTNDVYTVYWNPFNVVFDETMDGVYSLIDFEREKIKVFGYLISYHNGSSYGEQEREVPWSSLSLISDPIEEWLIACAKKVAEQKRKLEEAARKRLEEKAIIRSIIGDE